MKKVLGILTLTALMLTVTGVANAGGRISFTNSWFDDSTVLGAIKLEKKFKVDVNNYAELDTVINNTANSGENSVVVGNDAAFDFASGDSNASVNLGQEVNSTVIALDSQDGENCECAPEVVVDGIDADDSVISGEYDEENEEALDVNNYVDEKEEINQDSNTGRNNFLVGDDFEGKMTNPTITTGSPTAHITLNKLDNFTQITRGFLGSLGL